MKRLELVGKRFGKLTVLSFYCIDNIKNTAWKCLCDCGKEFLEWAIKVGNNCSLLLNKNAKAKTN